MNLSNVMFVKVVSKLEHLDGFSVPVVMPSVKIANKEDQPVQLAKVTFEMVIAESWKNS